MKFIDFYGSIKDDPDFNSFYNKYNNKFIQITKDKKINSYYVNYIYYKDDLVNFMVDSCICSNINFYCYNNNHIYFSKDILYGKSDVQIEIISKEEYIEYIDEWIDQVKSEMTKFEPD